MVNMYWISYIHKATNTCLDSQSKVNFLGDKLNGKRVRERNEHLQAPDLRPVLQDLCESEKNSTVAH